jgi:hypothetical protein
MVLRMAVKFLAVCPPNLLQCRGIRLMQRHPLCDMIFERDKRIAELYCPDQGKRPCRVEDTPPKHFVDHLLCKPFGDGGDGLGRLGQKDADRGVGDNFYLQTGRLGSLCPLSTEPCDPFPKAAGSV